MGLHLLLYLALSATIRALSFNLRFARLCHARKARTTLGEKTAFKLKLLPI